MVFSENQVRQLYVVTGVKDNIVSDITNGNTLKPGDTQLKVIGCSGDTFGDVDAEAYEFLAINAHNTPIHSDIIHKDNIRKVNLTDASALRMWLPTIDVENVLGNGDYETGDVFYINFSFPGFLNATDEEVETKTVAMRYNYDKTDRVMLSSDPLYNDWSAQMVEAIKLAFNSKRNLDNDLLKVTKVDAKTIRITAKEGNWILGTHNNKPNRIVIDNLTWENWHDVNLTSLPLENNSRVGVYGKAIDMTGKANTEYVPNGKITADLEYFLMGERGDQYRMKGWPHVIYTSYMVNPAKEYDYLDVHYYFQGEGVRSDKSEKVITLVAEHDSAAANKFKEWAKELCGVDVSERQSNIDGTEAENTSNNNPDTSVDESNTND